MKIRTILTGIAMAVALTGCSTQAATLDSGMPNQSPANQSTNVNNSINSDTVQISSEQNRGTDSSAQLKKEEKKVLMEPITLYEVDSREFAKKTSEIPSYHKGKIEYWTEDVVQSFNEGHSVTWGDPLVSTYLRISNLIPYEYFSDRSIDDQLSNLNRTIYKTVTITTANGISFTKNPTDPKTGTTIVQVDVPKWGTYVVTWNHGQDSDLQIIQKITFQRETKQ
ncbi:copper resistance protein CopC [Brevibacillus ruminantium]|uniref:Copper resistance protein CopC n=1 Tax=Brevibacillus ruminantium TaxID=2950604 RepID=A0ABY4WM84_9BACL|nr:copper resistance protein CopC [Brevibacillus ruminantium]USG67784.1 copper resistance protein CopC [Brevibacillus ruminantium]